MDGPLISVCIPTFNRANFLKECLGSLVVQFNKNELIDKVEIVVLDNMSKDNTEGIVKEYADRYKNIKYYKDTENRNIAGGQIEVGMLAKGSYIWFFSDDDKHSENALTTVIDLIENNKTDVLFCNTSTFNSEKIISKNNFKINKDVVLSSKKGLFSFISNHFYSRDFFFTFMSCYIVRRSLFENSMSLIGHYNSSLDLFPFHIPIYYTESDFTFTVVSDPVVLYREGNVSWGPKGKMEQEKFAEKIINNHMNNIFEFNKIYLSIKFKFKITMAKLLRKVVMIINNIKLKLIKD